MDKMMLFSIDSYKNDIIRLQDNILAPYAAIIASTLGGVDNINILITISLLPKNEWPNGILENSKYARFHFYRDGSLQMFSGNIGKFRKCTVKTIENAVDKINIFITKNS